MRCHDCKYSVRINYPFGRHSKPQETGHKKGCSNKIAKKRKKRRRLNERDSIH